MPRYYLHIREGESVVLDREGADFASLELALEEAVTSAWEIIAEAVRRSKAPDGQVFEITTEEGEVVRSMPFSSTIGTSDRHRDDRRPRHLNHKRRLDGAGRLVPR